MDNTLKIENEENFDLKIKEQLIRIKDMGSLLIVKVIFGLTLKLYIAYTMLLVNSWYKLNFNFSCLQWFALIVIVRLLTIKFKEYKKEELNTSIKKFFTDFGINILGVSMIMLIAFLVKNIF